MAISPIFHKATLVSGAVWVPKRALAVLFAFDILADIFGTVLEAVRTIAVSFSVFVLPFVRISVWQGGFTVAMAFFILVSITIVLLQK